MADALLGSVGEARLRDGRRITFAAVGPPRGFPILYFHGAIGSPRWRTPLLDALIVERGIRYVVVNRPGFAGSDPSPGRTVADFALDVKDLADSLGYGRFSIVGVSAGAPYALACGWALGDRVASIAAASPLAPPLGNGASAGLRYGLPRLAFGVPGIGPLVADAALRAVRLRGPTPPSAMIEDYDVCRRPWGFDPGEVAGQVGIWHGRRDRLVPVAHALRLASELPAATVCLEDGAGHFFLARCLEDIVGWLVDPALAGTSAEATILGRAA
jgi:pimeloyl-ACP methyl ester carboxylesterase